MKVYNRIMFFLEKKNVSGKNLTLGIVCVNFGKNTTLKTNLQNVTNSDVLLRYFANKYLVKSWFT